MVLQYRDRHFPFTIPEEPVYESVYEIGTDDPEGDFNAGQYLSGGSGFLLESKPLDDAGPVLDDLKDKQKQNAAHHE